MYITLSAAAAQLMPISAMSSALPSLPGLSPIRGGGISGLRILFDRNALVMLLIDTVSTKHATARIRIAELHFSGIPKMNSDLAGLTCHQKCQSDTFCPRENDPFVARQAPLVSFRPVGIVFPLEDLGR
jgi:hypothetical protein